MTKMLEAREDLYDVWDFDKNKDIFPDIKEVTKGSNKLAWWKCENHDSYEQTVKSKVKSSGCKVCSGRQLVVGFNDIATTNPKVANMMLNESDRTSNMEYSKYRVDWKCNNCNHIIKDKKIADISIYGLSCPNCSKDISYPERLVSNLLSELNVKFETQKTFEWSADKRYDFYLTELDTIIEVHGRQHFNGGFNTHDNGKELSDEISNDNLKLSLSNNNITNYIVIDARYSKLDYMKNSLSNSDIGNLKGFENIDWMDIEEKSRESISFKCLELFNSGKNVDEIAEIINMSDVSVRDYLHNWQELGRCEYTKNLRTKRKIVQMDMSFNVIKVWDSITEASMHLTGKKRNGSLNTSLSRNEKPALGYMWRYQAS